MLSRAGDRRVLAQETVSFLFLPAVADGGMMGCEQSAVSHQLSSGNEIEEGVGFWVIFRG
jgi:hypothetical protein